MAKKMISLEISDELREALRLLAFEKRTTLSGLIRALLEQAVKRSDIEYSEQTEENIIC